LKLVKLTSLFIYAYFFTHLLLNLCCEAGALCNNDFISSFICLSPTLTDGGGGLSCRPLRPYQLVQSVVSSMTLKFLARVQGAGALIALPPLSTTTDLCMWVVRNHSPGGACNTTVLYFAKLMKNELMGIFRTKRPWSVSKPYKSTGAF